MCGGSAKVEQDRGQLIWLGGLGLHGPGNFTIKIIAISAYP